MIGRLISLLANKQLFWLVLIVLLLFLSLWWVPGDSTSTADSYSSEEEGKLAFYNVVQRYFPRTQRSSDMLIPEDADTIMILGPARGPTDEEWSELYNFVSTGGRLLFANGRRSDSFESRAFRITCENDWTPEDEVQQAFQIATDITQTDNVKTFNNEYLPWRSFSSLESDSPYGTETLAYSTGKGAQVIRRQVGTGYAVFVASDHIFSNQSLLEPACGGFAFQLLEATEPASRARVYVDESLNSSGTPRVLGILFAPLFRSISLQALIVTVLFGWWGSRRFGPQIIEKSNKRRAIVEHAQALGNMHYKVGSANHVLRAYFEYFRTAAQVPGGRIDKVASTLAARSGFEKSAVEQLLNETQTAIQNDQIGSGTTATLITRLAELRDRMTLYGKSRDQTGSAKSASA